MKWNLALYLHVFCVTCAGTICLVQHGCYRCGWLSLEGNGWLSVSHGPLRLWHDWDKRVSVESGANISCWFCSLLPVGPGVSGDSLIPALAPPSASQVGHMRACARVFATRRPEPVWGPWLELRLSLHLALAHGLRRPKYGPVFEWLICLWAALSSAKLAGKEGLGAYPGPHFWSDGQGCTLTTWGSRATHVATLGRVYRDSSAAWAPSLPSVHMLIKCCPLLLPLCVPQHLDLSVCSGVSLVLDHRRWALTAVCPPAWPASLRPREPNPTPGFRSRREWHL